MAFSGLLLKLLHKTGFQEFVLICFKLLLQANIVLFKLYEPKQRQVRILFQMVGHLKLSGGYGLYG